MGGQEKALDKVRKLLAKADGTSNEHEAEAFYAKAQALMVEHAISEAHLAAAKPAGSQEKPVARKFEYSGSDANVPPKKSLLHYIAINNRCKAVFHGGSRHAQNAPIVGFESDLDFIELLYTSLLVQGTAAASKEFTPHAGIGRKAFLTQFLMGFVTRVGSRLVQANFDAMRAAEDKEPGSGLVLYGRTERVVDLFNEMFAGGLRTSRSRVGYDPSARAAGDRAGRNADITAGRGAVAGSRGALR